MGGFTVSKESPSRLRAATTGWATGDGPDSARHGPPRTRQVRSRQLKQSTQAGTLSWALPALPPPLPTLLLLLLLPLPCCCSLPPPCPPSPLPCRSPLPIDRECTCGERAAVPLGDLVGVEVDDLPAFRGDHGHFYVEIWVGSAKTELTSFCWRQSVLCGVAGGGERP